jgi:hypothetical protein
VSLQIQSNFVPPILSTLAPNCFGSNALPSSVSHCAVVQHCCSAAFPVRRFVACQVLSDVTRTAAARFNCLATSRTHLPCSRLHARLAGDIAVSAGRLLPYPFTPYLVGTTVSAPAGLLSVAVVVAGSFPTRRPHLLFHGAIASVYPNGSREVPLPAITGSDDTVALNSIVKLHTRSLVAVAIKRVYLSSTRSLLCQIWWLSRALLIDNAIYM